MGSLDNTLGVTVRLVIRVITTVQGLFILTIVAVTGLQVIMRFAFDSPFFWSEELSLVAYVWLVFVGAIGLTLRQDHIAVELFSLRRTPGLAKITRVTGILGLVAANSLVAYGSYAQLIKLGRGQTAALGIPNIWLYGVPWVCIGFAAIAGVIALVAPKAVPQRDLSHSADSL